ncbi:MAG: heme-binding protein [Planctomycetota bacterium]
MKSAPNRSGTLRKAASIGLVTVVSMAAAGCLRVSNGTWYIKSAATPEGWPALTPVGSVEVKDYPVYRAAIVTEVDIAEEDRRSMFMELFRHISAEDIAMTAPVDMGYADAPGGPRMTSMAFLYGSTDQGSVGTDGPVRVEDLSSRRYASVGVRGGYTNRNYERGLALLDTWLSENPGWKPDGPPRYLGYNSPFVPSFCRYGEVQIVVIDEGDGADATGVPDRLATAPPTRPESAPRE